MAELILFVVAVFLGRLWFGVVYLPLTYGIPRTAVWIWRGTVRARAILAYIIQPVSWSGVFLVAAFMVTLTNPNVAHALVNSPPFILGQLVGVVVGLLQRNSVQGRRDLDADFRAAMSRYQKVKERSDRGATTEHLKRDAPADDLVVIDAYSRTLETLGTLAPGGRPEPFFPESALPYPRERISEALEHQVRDGFGPTVGGPMLALSTFVPDAELWATRDLWTRLAQAGSNADAVLESAPEAQRKAVRAALQMVSDGAQSARVKPEMQFFVAAALDCLFLDDFTAGQLAVSVALTMPENIRNGMASTLYWMGLAPNNTIVFLAALATDAPRAGSQRIIDVDLFRRRTAELVLQIVEEEREPAASDQELAECGSGYASAWAARDPSVFNVKSQAVDLVMTAFARPPLVREDHQGARDVPLSK